MAVIVFAPLICAAALLLQQAGFQLYTGWRRRRASRRWLTALDAPVLQRAAAEPDEALAYLAATLPGFAMSVYSAGSNGALRTLHHNRKPALVSERVVARTRALLSDKTRIRGWLDAVEDQELDAAIIEDGIRNEPGEARGHGLRSALWPWRRESAGMYLVRIAKFRETPKRQTRSQSYRTAADTSVWAVGFFDRCAYLPAGHLLHKNVAAVFEVPHATEQAEAFETATPRQGADHAARPKLRRDADGDILRADRDAQLARVIHDVRLPLTRLFAMLDNLQDRVRGQVSRGSAKADEADENEIERGFARIARQLRTMESFTYDILNVESGGTVDRDGEATVLNVADRVRQIVDAHLDLIQRKRITVLYDFPAPHATDSDDSDYLLSIRAQSMALDRILFNLLTNSFQFCSSPGQIHLGLARRARHLLLDIEDSGPGLVSQENAFELSRRNIGRGGSGWGIGLASARDLSRRLGGRLVAARPRHGKGARFLLVLPGVPVQSGKR